jgi:hypothetical protein
MLSNLVLFVQGLFLSWLFWVGLVFRMTPFLDRFFESHPGEYPRIERWAKRYAKDIKLVASVCVLIACARVWSFEHKNTQTVISEKASVWGKYNQCDKDLALKSQLADVYSGTIGTQHTQLYNQQDTFNRCVLALGITNKPEPLVIRVDDASFNGNYGKDRSGKDMKLWIFTVFVNKSVSPFQGTFRCKGDFVVAQGRTMHSNSDSDWDELNSSHRKEDGGYRIELAQPGTWRPDMPLVFGGLSVEQPKGCTFQLD